MILRDGVMGIHHPYTEKDTWGVINADLFRMMTEKSLKMMA
jgi:hypothetical protein